MPRTSISTRLQGFLLVAVVLACAVFLAVRFWPRDHVENLLRRLPPDSAILLYVDVRALGQTARESSMPVPWALGLTADRVDGFSLALAEHELHVAVAGDFSAGLVDALLAQQGLRCGQSLSVAPCQVSLEHGPILLQIPESGTLLATTASALASGLSSTVDSRPAKAALGQGAVVWAEIDPQRLEKAMEDPPPHWINLQLIARALEPAHVAYLTLTPTTPDNISVQIEAHCRTDGTEQLERVLAGLNDMGLALLLRDREATEQWETTMRSFKSSTEEGIVRVSWTLPVDRLAALWGAN